MLGGGADQLPGPHYKRTDELHAQRDAAQSKVNLLQEEGGPRERALESKWGKMLGGGADQLPGPHYHQTDVLRAQRDVAQSKVAFLQAGPRVGVTRERALENKWGKMLGGGADQIPGPHYHRTDVLHEQREVAQGH